MFTLTRPFMNLRLHQKRKDFEALPLRHQLLLPRFVDHLSDVQHCVEHNNEIIKIIVENTDSMFVNRDDYNVSIEGGSPSPGWTPPLHTTQCHWHPTRPQKLEWFTVRLYSTAIGMYYSPLHHIDDMCVQKGFAYCPIHNFTWRTCFATSFHPFIDLWTSSYISVAAWWSLHYKFLLLILLISIAVKPK